MNRWLKFLTLEAAISAVSIIDNNMGFPLTYINADTGIPASDKQKAISWAEPIETSDSPACYCIPKPKSEYMTNVSGYDEIDFGSISFKEVDLSG